MSQWCWAAFVFLLVLLPGPRGHVGADEKGGPRRPPTPQEAADAALQAVKAGDQEGLKAIASRAAPDPWIVADELCYRGQHAAAKALAAASQAPAVKKLPAYVESRRGKPDDAATAAALMEMAAAAGRGDWQGVLRVTKDAPAESGSLAPIRMAYWRGVALFRTDRREDSLEAFRLAAEGARALGWLRQESGALQSIGFVAFRLPDWPTAMAAWKARLPILAALGDGFNTATTLIDLGTVHHRLGQFDEALDAYGRATKLAEAHGDKRMLAGLLGNVGLVHEKRGDFQRALDTYRRALTVVEALGDKRAIAGTLSNMGMAYMQLGSNEEAESIFRRALALDEAAGNMVGVARTLGNLGNVLQSLGRFHEALEAYERARKLDEARNDRPRLATVLTNMGILHRRLGAYEEALDAFGRALVVHEATGAVQKVAVALSNLSGVHQELNDLDTAQECSDRALAAYEAAGSKHGVATSLLNAGAIQRERGAVPAAVSSFERSISLAESIGALPVLVDALCHLASVQRHQARPEDALATYERALHVLETCPLPIARARVLHGLAATNGDLEQWSEAVRYAREAVRLIDALLAGLGEEQGARARDLWTGPYEVGALASFNAGAMEDFAYFLEGGRARSLLESLDGRTALRSVLIPSELRDEEASARLAVTHAVQSIRDAAGGGSVKAARVAKKCLVSAQHRLEETVTKIQRTAKAAASLAYPVPNDLITIRKRLAEDEALVLYGQAGAEALALVVRSDAARAVHLGPASTVFDACAALVGDAQRHVEPGQVGKVRGLVVEPLALGKSARRVLVSPVGRLGYVPFTLLMPDREVVYVPSATTYGVLHTDRGLAGRSVLALGDPDYGPLARRTSAVHRGAALARLSPLPATRAEATAVGEITLLGRQAAETTLVKTLGMRERWRAVHFACHGLVDPDRPMLSALALSADAESDGLLTCLEVFRMKIPADLVVLSACETGKGRLYRAEGIVGLTRAFMFAGSPRVLCSLWKVDDEATQTLMVKFYGLWNPNPGSGIGAAAALKKAQEFVRSHKKWEHPYYWAAWVLWGLP